MANSSTIAGGRPVSVLNGGRSVATVVTSWASNEVGWPRTGAMCAPVQPCCCKGPWEIGPGETLPLTMLWQRWIDSVPGYTLNKVTEASLLDVNVNPERPADPDVIKLVSGTDDDEEADNEDATDFVGIIPPYLTHTLVAVSPDARIGQQFRFNLAVTARDCDGRKITMRDCVVIVIAEC